MNDIPSTYKGKALGRDIEWGGLFFYNREPYMRLDNPATQSRFMTGVKITKSGWPSKGARKRTLFALDVSYQLNQKQPKIFECPDCNLGLLDSPMAQKTTGSPCRCRNCGKVRQPAIE